MFNFQSQLHEFADKKTAYNEGHLYYKIATGLSLSLNVAIQIDCVSLREFLIWLKFFHKTNVLEKTIYSTCPKLCTKKWNMLREI